MVASRGTVDDMARVLAEELGRQRAFELVSRLYTEVRGNRSFNETLARLIEKLGE